MICAFISMAIFNSPVWMSIDITRHLCIRPWHPFVVRSAFCCWVPVMDWPREILRWPSVRSVTLVELDPLILDIARRHPRLLALNQGSLTDPRVTVLTGDAFAYTRRLDESFDVVIADFPDPDRISVVARLYSVGFYQSLRRLLAPEVSL